MQTCWVDRLHVRLFPRALRIDLLVEVHHKEEALGGALARLRSAQATACELQLPPTDWERKWKAYGRTADRVEAAVSDYTSY